ncbi:MAG: hypothetical protein ACTHNM_05800 [Dyella sp.]|uniref:hypothetical protein n=1 Tax=Dyella sp. TaxID=1869338 RepID=UPI003F818680
MPQIINLFLLIGGVIATGIGLARLRHDPLALLWLAGGVAVVVLSYLGDKRRVQRKHARDQRRATQRTAELARASLTYGRPLTVPSSIDALALSLLTLLLGVAIVYFAIIDADTPWLIWLAGPFLLAFGMLLSARAASSLGKPVMVLSARGVELPLYGLIPWPEVEGLHLQRVASRGHERFALLLRVPRLADITPAHWTDRAMALVRLGPRVKGVVPVPLSRTSEPPEAIYSVARQFWTKATSRDHDWWPDASPEVNAALGRLNHANAVWKSANASELKEPEHPAPEMAQVEKDMETVRRDLERRASRLRRTMAILLAVASIAIALRILGLWLKARGF